MWLFVGSWTFSSVFSYLGGHEVFEHFFKSMDLALAVSCDNSNNYFYFRLAIRMDRDIDYICSNIFTITRLFGVNPYLFAMLIALIYKLIFNTANGNVCLLSQGSSIKKC